MTTLRGTVQTGRREAAGFLTVPWVAERLRGRYGFVPYPGTLNLRIETPEDQDRWEALRDGPGWWILLPEAVEFCDAACLPVLVQGKARGVIVVPDVPGYPRDLVEVVAPENLRERLGLRDGDPCLLEAPPAPFFSCVLFDLEGTLVDFQWKLAEAEEELREAAADLGYDRRGFASDNYAGILHRALDLAASPAAREDVARRLGPIYDRYDLDALSRWSPRPDAAELLADLRARGVSLGLVTNIGRRAAEGALDRFGLRPLLGARITRNDVTRLKPDGEGIRKALRGLGCGGRALMVGDSLSDLYAAREAGLPVAIVSGGECSEQTIRAHGPDHLLASLSEVLTVVCPETA
ncbi:MAG: HAD-IA family hydrolase [Deferrisomatales bacterium]